MEFDRIVCLDEPMMPTTPWQNDVGVITIENGSARFDGKRHLTLAHIVSVERVRSHAFRHALVRVGYTDGQTVATVYFTGRYPDTIDQLFGMLEQLRASAAPGSIAPQVIDMYREKAFADQVASSRRAGKLMWAGAALLLVGVVVTVVTYTRVASTGGTYIVAWGAILGGVIMILNGFLRRPK